MAMIFNKAYPFIFYMKKILLKGILEIFTNEVYFTYLVLLFFL